MLLNEILDKEAKMTLDDVLNEARIIFREPKGSLWFQHESPYKLSTLSPQTYLTLAKIRPDYDIDARKEQEDLYRKLVDHASGTSFLYATIVGKNKMESPTDYPGYTYYFQMDDPEIEKCIFDVVDKKKWMDPTKGLIGLEKARAVWTEHAETFKPFNEKDFGMVDPRIEVVIPFSIKPTKYVTHQEDRV